MHRCLFSMFLRFIAVAVARPQAFRSYYIFGTNYCFVQNLSIRLSKLFTMFLFMMAFCIKTSRHVNTAACSLLGMSDMCGYDVLDSRWRPQHPISTWHLSQFAVPFSCTTSWGPHGTRGSTSSSVRAFVQHSTHLGSSEATTATPTATEHQKPQHKNIYDLFNYSHTIVSQHINWVYICRLLVSLFREFEGLFVNIVKE